MGELVRQCAGDLSPAEKSALAFADRMATDHLSISDDTFADLRSHFRQAEIMDLCFQVATFVGYGRMGSALAMIDEGRVIYEFEVHGTYGMH